MRYQPESWLDRLVGVACAILTASILLYLAARVVAAVWPVLVGIGVSVVAVAGLVTVLRWRRQGW